MYGERKFSEELLARGIERGHLHRRTQLYGNFSKLA
jgi:hypothetical protein